MDGDGDFGKAVFRVDRSRLLRELSLEDGFVPISLDNVVHVINHRFVHHPEVRGLMPEALREQLERRRVL